MAKSSTTRQAVSEIDRVFENNWILDKRIRGLTIAQIAEAAELPAVRNERGMFSNSDGLGKSMGYSTVRRRYLEAMIEPREELTELANTYQASMLQRHEAQLARLDALVKPYVIVHRRGVAYVEDNDPTVMLRAEDQIRKVVVEIRKLLGTDEPTKVEVAATVTHEDATTIELARLMDEAVAHEQAR